MEAVLTVLEGAWKHQLRYATAVFLDCMGQNDYSLQVRPAGKQGGGLALDGHQVVDEAELKEIFRSLSLQREMECGRTDPFGRFEETAATWETSQPWVDLRAQQAAASLVQINAAKRNGFQVFITHDIDRTTVCEPTSVLKALLKCCGLVQRTTMPLRTVLSRDSILCTIEKMLELERRHRVGAYYFMMSGPYGYGRYSTRTDIRWSTSRKVIQLVQDAGMTIGLHGSFAAKERQTYQEERERVEQVARRPVTCHRNHYLRFDTRQICQQLQKAGLQYDFSVGFVSRIGFRAGCGSAYRMFDYLQNQPSGLVQIPLLFMDSVLRFCKGEEIPQQLRSALQAVKRVHGCVGLLFHPEMFLARADAWPLFEKTIEICHELGADLSGKLPQVTQVTSPLPTTSS